MAREHYPFEVEAIIPQLEDPDFVEVRISMIIQAKDCGDAMRVATENLTEKYVIVAVVNLEKASNRKGGCD